MATNLAGGVCIGSLNACVLRVARLDADCSPTYGADSGIATSALVTLTADPDIEAGTRFEPKNGCGEPLFVYEQEDRVKRFTMSGELGLWDFEMMSMLFGGSLVLGRTGTAFPAEVVAYAERLYSDAPRNGIYLEVITQAVSQDNGPCGAGGGDVPVAIGHIFGRAMLTPGSVDFGNDVSMVRFSGYGTNNPNLDNGPWEDWPGVGDIPNSPYVRVLYGQAEYDAILDTVACGFQTLTAPVGAAERRSNRRKAGTGRRSTRSAEENTPKTGSAEAKAGASASSHA